MSESAVLVLSLTNVTRLSMGSPSLFPPDLDGGAARPEQPRAWLSEALLARPDLQARSDKLERWS
ncbi:hypothetical protein [Bosea sp. 685]|uniref:hypothetical protein n=1 Tax=Bosea sp. 685 TaxID=3080057 RepID=UPI002892EA32|nr:hypothetical protein [Bosea sp. 685]WNJ92681.1 hypothetical protein RMR04_10425 [Bosea sp. 685]